jgi:hypothetical protein
VKVQFDPAPAETLTSLWARLPRVADGLDEAVDWIEAGDARARRRRFSNGMWAISRVLGGTEWLVLWEEDPPGVAVVRHVGEATSI